jgi:hypothetical protein
MLCKWYDFYSLSMLSTGAVCGKLVWGPGGFAETCLVPHRPTRFRKAPQLFWKAPKVFCKSVLQMVSAPQKRVTTCTTRFCDVEHGCRKTFAENVWGGSGSLRRTKTFIAHLPRPPNKFSANRVRQGPKVFRILVFRFPNSSVENVYFRPLNIMSVV